MGREAEGMIRFRDQGGAGRILIEATEVILRGEVRARVPRDEIAGLRVEGEDLVIDTMRGPVVATVGSKLAENLRVALLKPVPTLVEKLGVSAGGAGCLWPVTDEVLSRALAGLTVPVEEAKILVAELLDQVALDWLVALLPGLAGRHVWCVNAKGPRPVLPEAAIRGALRDAGWIDSKTTAVSDAVSATRYGVRRGLGDGV